jgi:RNA polymerase sigma factor (sigma-70 family)
LQNNDNVRLLPCYSMANIEKTIERLSEGDELALAVLIDRYASLLIYQSEGIVCNHALAEEIVGDVFLKLWDERRNITEIQNIQAWLSTVNYHCSVSALRKESHHKHDISLDMLPGFVFPDIQTSGTQEMEEKYEKLKAAIEELPEKCKYVFFLAKIQKLPYDDIARSLHITLATVNYHVGYAVKTLRKKFARKELLILLIMLFSVGL